MSEFNESLNLKWLSEILFLWSWKYLYFVTLLIFVLDVSSFSRMKQFAFCGYLLWTLQFIVYLRLFAFVILQWLVIRSKSTYTTVTHLLVGGQLPAGLASMVYTSKVIIVILFSRYWQISISLSFPNFEISRFDDIQRESIDFSVWYAYW